ATMADFFGNRWQVNALMIPTPFRKKAVPYLQPVGEVMALYEKYKGDTAVSVEGPPDLDMTGSRKGNTLFLHVANTTLNRSIKASFQIEGKKIINGKVHEIAVDPDFEITELEPHALRPVSFSIKDDSWTFSPASVSVVVLQLEDEL
ncbi:MAG: hypothetical protein GX112_08000, partial [Clostridiaceae bacterium]|nr:hypothetical protein [Clostridiaceae bacterium]